MRSIFGEYIKYLKDNPNHYWFRRKIFGWGWTPATWQGWIVLLLFAVLVVLNFKRIDSVSHSASDTLINFIPQLIIMTFVLIGICYKKGEKPKWQWGFPKNNINNKDKIHE